MANPLTNSISLSTSSISLNPDTVRNAELLAVRGKGIIFAILINFFVEVMRLSKPALHQNIPIYAEEESSSSANAFLAGQTRDIGMGNDQSILSNLLVLPYSFGWVYSSRHRLINFFLLAMCFWVKSSRQLFHYIIRVIRYFEMLF